MSVVVGGYTDSGAAAEWKRSGNSGPSWGTAACAVGEPWDSGLGSKSAAAVPLQTRHKVQKLSDRKEIALEFGGTIRLVPEWLTLGEADALFRELLESVSWHQGSIHVFGREIPEPRLTAWFGNADYTYSGRTVRACPWPAPLAKLRTRVESEVGSPFNAVLLNLYRNGADSMGMHSDDEPELGLEPVVASVSLGDSRRFILSPKAKSARGRVANHEMLLSHGSLLVMGAGCQDCYRHRVPKEPGRNGVRINLTFRYVLHADCSYALTVRT